MGNFIPRSYWHLTVGTAVIVMVTIMAAIILWLLQLLVSQLTIKHRLKVFSNWHPAASTFMILSKHHNIQRHMNEASVKMISHPVSIKEAPLKESLGRSSPPKRPSHRENFSNKDFCFSSFKKFTVTICIFTFSYSDWVHNGWGNLLFWENSLLLMA